LWFVASIIAHSGSDHAAFTAWLGHPLAGMAMVLLLIALFHHLALGLEVVIADYLHARTRLVALVTMRSTCAALALCGVAATLRIAIGA
jgi:succinate dehydrogenase / fumarate reductase membrane anchor subunit